MERVVGKLSSNRVSSRVVCGAVLDLGSQRLVKLDAFIQSGVRFDFIGATIVHPDSGHFDVVGAVTEWQVRCGSE